MWEQIDWATEFDIANTEFNIDPVAGGNNPATGLRVSAGLSGRRQCDERRGAD